MAIFMEVEAGNCHTAELQLHADMTVTFYLSFYRIGVEHTLIQWTPKDIIVASEYASHSDDYRIGEAKFYRTLYQRACMKPNYPVPAIIQCDWCGSRTDTCDYNDDGIWCPSLCFTLN